MRVSSLCLITVASLGAGVMSSPGSAMSPPAKGLVRATDTWGPVHRFERYPSGQSLVVDSRDVVTVVWGSPKGWPEPVKVAQRTAAGRWRAPVRLGAGYNPVVGADARGNLTVAWCRDRRGFTTGVWAARKPLGRPWTRPVRLSKDLVAPGYPDGGSVYGATNLDVAVHPGGAALVTWEWGAWERDVPLRIQAAYRPARGPWGSRHAVTPAAEASNAHIAFARNGTFWVAYQRTPKKGPTAVKVRARSAAGVWSPATRVGVGTLGDVGVDKRGNVTVAFGARGQVRVALRKAPAGVWKPPRTVTPTDVHVRGWAVALNRFGAALVPYLRKGGVDVVRRTIGGRWTKPVTLAEPDRRLSGVFTAINRRGDMFAGWENSYGMWGRYRPSGQPWHAVTTVQPDSGVDVLEEVLVRVAPGGDVILLWDQEERALRARVLNVS